MVENVTQMLKVHVLKLTDKHDMNEFNHQGCVTSTMRK